MKLIKMKIRREKIQGGTRYGYPTPHYDAHKVLFGPVYEAGLERKINEVNERNKDKSIGEEFIIVGVDEIDAAQFLKANGFVKDGFEFSAVEIDDDTAIAHGNDWTETTVKVTDQKKINEIAEKVGKGETLTQEELDALNPDKKEVKGFSKSETFAESLFKGKLEASKIRADRVKNKVIK